MASQIFFSVDFILNSFLGVRPLNECPDMTLNNLMSSLQLWRFGKYGISLHCHCSQGHSDPEWRRLIGLGLELPHCISVEEQDPSNECPRHDSKQSDVEPPATEVWGMESTLSLPSLPGFLWFEVIAPDSPICGWNITVWLIKHKQMTDI